MTAGTSQYDHPLWQRRRLQFFEAHGWRCQKCNTTETQLHLHHKRYVRGRKVWDYEDDDLEGLCKTCHAAHHERQRALLAILVALPDAEVDRVLGYAKARLAVRIVGAGSNSAARTTISDPDSHEVFGAGDAMPEYGAEQVGDWIRGAGGGDLVDMLHEFFEAFH